MENLRLFLNTLWRQHLLTAKPKPRVHAVLFVHIRQGWSGLLLIAHIEQITKGFHFIPLFSIPQKLTHGKVHILSQKVQKSTFNRPLCFYHKFQLADVQSLNPLSVIFCCSCAAFMDTIQNAPVFPYRLPYYQRNTAF